MRKTLQNAFYSLMAIFLLGGGSGLPAVHGQETPPKTEETPKLLQQWIYIPYQNLKDVWGARDATIVLPLAEYLELWNRAHQQGLKPGDQPPVPAIISEGRYTARVEKETVRLTVQWKILSLNPGWAVLPISLGDAAVGKITSNSNQVLLQSLGQGKLALLIPKAGEHEVQLELVTKVSVSPDGRRFELQVPPAGISRLELTIPEADQVVELSPATVVEPLTVPPGIKETRLSATLKATDQLKVNWHPRVGSRPDMELLTSVNQLTSVQVQDGLIHTHSQLRYDILRGQLENLQIAVPADHRVLDVTSDVRLREWTLSTDKGQQVISVSLLGRVDQPATIQVHTERSIPEENFSVAGISGGVTHGIHALNVLRERGQLALKAGSEINLTVEQQRGLQRIEEAAVAGSIRAPGAIYFSYFSPEFELELRARPVEPRLLVEHKTQLVFTENQLRLNSTLDYTIERAGVFELRWLLPEGLTIENVTCAGMKQFDVNEATRELVVQFSEKRLGALSLNITGFLNWKSDEPARALPILQPQQAEVENGQITVFAPEALEILTESEKVRLAQPDPSVPQSQIGLAKLISAWRYQQQPVFIPVSTSRKPTRLTARLLTRLDVLQGTVRVESKVHYLVEYAGLSTFRFQVPESIANQIQITSLTETPIKQRTRDEKAVDGWVTWTVVLQRDALGQQPFLISYDIPQESQTDTSELKIGLIRLLDSPINTNGTGDSPMVTPAEANAEADEEAEKAADPVTGQEPAPVSSLVTLTRIVGEVLVTKDRALAVDTNATGGDVKAIDTRELTTPTDEGFAAFRYFRQPIEVTLKSSRLGVQGVVQTVISRSLAEVVIDKSGAAAYRVRYAIKSSERQRLRIDLPGDAQPLGAIMGDRPVALEKSPGATEKGPYSTYFVNVARASSAEDVFHVTILFRLPLSPKPFTSNGGTLLLRLPVWGGVDAQGIVTQQQKLAVWVPEEYSLVGSPRGYTLESRRKLSHLVFAKAPPPLDLSQLDQWVGQASIGMFDFPHEGRGSLYSRLGSSHEVSLMWWRLPFYAWVAAIGLVLVALILRRTPLENKLTVLLLAATLLAACALADADLVLHVIAAASYGLAAMIGIWLIACLTSCCGSKRTTKQVVPLETKVEPSVSTAREPIPVYSGADAEAERKAESTGPATPPETSRETLPEDHSKDS